MGVVFGVMSVWNLVHLWECVMLPALLHRVITSAFLPCYHSALLPVLDMLLLIFALGEMLTLKTCRHGELLYQFAETM